MSMDSNVMAVLHFCNVFLYLEKGSKNSLSLNSKCHIVWLGLSQRALFVFIWIFISLCNCGQFHWVYLAHWTTKFLLQHLLVKYSRMWGIVPRNGAHGTLVPQGQEGFSSVLIHIRYTEGIFASQNQYRWIFWKLLLWTFITFTVVVLRDCSEMFILAKSGLPSMNCATMCRSMLKDPVCGTVGGKHSISLATETMEKKTINICHHLHPASNHSWPLPAPSILTENACLSPAAAETG